VEEIGRPSLQNDEVQFAPISHEHKARKRLRRKITHEVQLLPAGVTVVKKTVSIPF
jgi:hypothetical protein